MSDQKGHTLSDWLVLHDLDPPLCRTIVAAAATQWRREAADRAETTTLQDEAAEPDRLWLAVFEAMCALFPSKRQVFSDAFDNIARVRVDALRRSQRSLTVNDGDGLYPKIFYSFTGAPSDHLVMAHEFAHAIQLIQCEKRFVPPMVRELCAFLGEHAMQRHARNQNLNFGHYLDEAMLRDSKKYVIGDGNRLLSCLDDLSSSYTYTWNYPIARYLAASIARGSSPDLQWQIFEGRLSMRQIIEEVHFEN